VPILRPVSIPRPAVLAASLLVAAVAAVAPGEARAFGKAREGFGVGIGSATIANGLSLKFAGGTGSIQGVVGFWGRGPLWKRARGIDGVAVGVDFLYEMPSLATSPFFTLDWSFGLGAGVGVSEFDGGKAGLAASGIAGLEFNFTEIPLDVTIEYRPTLDVLPDVDLDLIDFTAHVRIWF
jgi:hypothetical protein